ncbi:MAG TPA: copper transporter, partial [Jatrophihabitantaceae bacterium]|nr:copper transporter [Jatrophihabitantaceae bacterium]
MISFRYHLVSIIAVFLAVALGIVIGTTALNGPITTDLRNQVNTLKNDRTNLAQQVKSLQGQVNNADAFADTFGSSVVAGTLSKQSVLVVTMPGASSTTRDGVLHEITAAGGKIAGNIALTPNYIDQRRSSDIISLVTTDQPNGLTLPLTNDPAALGAALLSYVLLGKGNATDLTQVVSAFAQLHMLSVESNVVPSTNVVIVGTGT